ncbi:MAG: histidine kinase [Sphingobacteriaceae bacterium]|nr:MAG: histidine kinase [Sphingobacteriaceae bacterium]
MKRNNNEHIKRIAKHILFWLIITGVLPLLCGYNLPSYEVAFIYIALLMLANVLYFYTVTCWAIPQFFYRKRYVKLAFAFLACVITSAVICRVIEVAFVEPYLNQMITGYGQTHLSTGDNFLEKLTSFKYFIHAVSSTNGVIGIALTIKFIVMWIDKRQITIETELNFLKSRIHPHFLFNTLNNLYALTLKQSSESPKVILGFSNILRYMLYECSTKSVLLKRDIEVLQSYINLEKIRYEKLNLSFDISGNTGDVEIPPLLMLPLVENAFKNDISETTGNPWMNINLYINRNNVVFKVSNSKQQTYLTDTDYTNAAIDINNLRKRLKLLHGNNQLNIYTEDNMNVAVLTIDLNYHEN